MSIDKFKSTFEGKNASDLATIQEGRRLMELLQTAAPRYRGGMGLPEASLLAEARLGGGLTAMYFTTQELQEEGFPEDQPAHLHLKLEMGPTRNTDDDFGDEHINPFRTKNGVLLEVRDALDTIGKHGDHGYERLFTTIATAAGYVPPKVVFAASIPPAPVVVSEPAPAAAPEDKAAKAAKTK